MKKVIIIGSGIAGLTAGIYLRQYGFETEIYEQHFNAGGECTGWDRKGYHIDNCIHWLTESEPGTDLYEVWKNIDAVNEDIRMLHEDYFYRVEYAGKTLGLSTDLNQARQEFLAEAPEDEKEINRFFDYVKLAESMRVPARKSVADMNVLEMIKLGMGMADIGKLMKEYGQDTVPEIAARFKNPLLQNAIKRYLSGPMMGFTLLVSYAFLSGGRSGIPEGGSRQMAARITKRYLDLGGKLFTGKKVDHCVVKGAQVQGIQLADGTIVNSDFVICATDTHITFTKLLGEKYWDPKLKNLYGNQDYKVSSAFQAAFGIIGEEETKVPSGSFLFPCESIQIGRREEDYLGIRTCDYDQTLNPAGKQVIQINYLQDEEDYLYWQELSRDPEAYRQEKARLAEEIQRRIIKRFPQLEKRLLLLDTFTPLTYERFCGAYRGAYMSFFAQKGAKSVYAKNTVKGLKNVVLAGQWLSLSGGLPTAAASGKFAADKVRRLSGRNS